MCSLCALKHRQHISCHVIRITEKKDKSVRPSKQPPSLSHLITGIKVQNLVPRRKVCPRFVRYPAKTLVSKLVISNCWIYT
jgi:hypothetical protein